MFGGSTLVLRDSFSRVQADSLSQPHKSIDEEMCRSKFTLAADRSLVTRPINEVMIAIGTSFVGTPYAANTLEQPGEEDLVINLRGLDCVTFLENTLALSRCIKMKKTTFHEYKRQLQLIRYRSGEINGYPSRLHYFSDWLYDNDRKHIVRNMAEEIGGIELGKKINFMSTHRSAYRQLKDNGFLKRVETTEADINGRTQYFIPKEKLAAVEQQILSGDIIGITTTVEGLDIAHTGIAIQAGGALKYLHAPLSNGRVQITEKTLVDYLLGMKKQTGIMIARPLEPVS